MFMYLCSSVYFTSYEKVASFWIFDENGNNKMKLATRASFNPIFKVVCKSLENQLKIWILLSTRSWSLTLIENERQLKTITIRNTLENLCRTNSNVKLSCSYLITQCKFKRIRFSISRVQVWILLSNKICSNW